MVVPHAGWLIDRTCTFEKEKVHEDEASQNLIVILLNKSVEFYDSHFNEGVSYLLGGVLPMAYKYITAFYNLINYKDKDEVNEGMKKMGEMLDVFIEKNDLFCRFASTKASKKLPEQFSWCNISDKISVSVSTVKEKDKIQVAEEMRMYCAEMIKNIEHYYDGQNDYKQTLFEYQEITEEQYKENLNATRFSEDIESDDIHEKMRVLNALIKVYKSCKKDYMTMDADDPLSLMNFFKRNKDNLRGIFETCIDRLFYDQN